MTTKLLKNTNNLYKLKSNQNVIMSQYLVKILTFLFLIPTSYAGEFRHFNEWTNLEKAEFAGYTTLSIIDYNQTEWALDQNRKQDKYQYIELNPLLGSNPSDTTLLTTFALQVAFYYWMIGSDSEDKKYLRYGRGFASSFRLAAVIHNDGIGARITKVF